MDIFTRLHCKSKCGEPLVFLIRAATNVPIYPTPTVIVCIKCFRILCVLSIEMESKSLRTVFFFFCGSYSNLKCFLSDKTHNTRCTHPYTKIYIIII